MVMGGVGVLQSNAMEVAWNSVKKTCSFGENYVAGQVKETCTRQDRAGVLCGNK